MTFKKNGEGIIESFRRRGENVHTGGSDGSSTDSGFLESDIWRE